MINQLDRKLMTNVIPKKDVSNDGALKGTDNSRKSADSTQKDTSEQYIPLDLEFEFTKEEVAEMKEKYPDKAEFDLVNTYKYRRRVLEFGTEMFYLMMEYWKKKLKRQYR